MKNKKLLLIVLFILSLAMMFSGCAAIQKALVGTPLDGLFGNPKPEVRIIADGEFTIDDVKEKVKVEIKSADKSTILALTNASITVSGLDKLTIGSDNEISVVYDGVTATSKITIVAKSYEMNYIAGSNGKIVGASSQKIKEGSKSEAVEAVANDGYIFSSWSDGKTDAVRSDDAKNLSVIAVFAPKTLKITFLDDMGNELIVSKSSVKYNELWKKENDPKVDFLPPSKQFVCFKDQDGLQLNYNSPITKDMTYKMVVKEKTVTITYRNEDGTTYKNVTLPYGEKLVHKDVVDTDPEKIGHTFNGWTFYYQADENTDLDKGIIKDLTFMPIFDPASYKVTFECDEYTENQDIKYGLGVMPPITDPKGKTGSEFSGWRDKKDSVVNKIDFSTYKVKGNVTFVPIWKPIPLESCTIILLNRKTNKEFTINKNKGETVGDLSSYITPIEGYKIIPGEGIIDQITKEIVYASQIVTSDMRLEIRYTEIVLEISFITTIEGQTIAPRLVKYNELLQLPTVGIVAGTADLIITISQQLNGWRVNGEMFDPKTKITTDLVLTADISIKKCKVTLKTPPIGATVYINDELYNDKIYVEYGSKIAFKIILDEGTTFITTKPSIKINNGFSRELRDLKNNAYAIDISSVQDDTNISFEIKQQTYNVNYVNSVGLGRGSIKVQESNSIGIVAGSHNTSNKTLQVSHNGTLVFSILPMNGYRTVSAFYGASETPDNRVPIDANNTLTLTNVKKDGKLFVNFERIIYSVDWSVNTDACPDVKIVPQLREQPFNENGTQGNPVNHANLVGFTTTYGSEIQYTTPLVAYDFEIYINNGSSVVKVYEGINGTYYRINANGTKVPVNSSDTKICSVTESITIVFKILKYTF